VGIFNDLIMAVRPQSSKPIGGLRVRHSVHRCPFCHEACPPRDSVACLHCLGRHHVACWVESSVCATCGADEWLVPESRAFGFRSDQELSALLQTGRADEVEDYLEQCQGYADETRKRTTDLATRLAFEQLSETLGQLRAFQVVGSRPAPSAATRLFAWVRVFVSEGVAPTVGVNRAAGSRSSV
jgi:hypothetical protein